MKKCQCDHQGKKKYSCRIQNQISSHERATHKKEIRARVCVCVLERKSKYRNIVLSPHDDDDNFTLAVHSSEQVSLSTHTHYDFPILRVTTIHIL